MKTVLKIRNRDEGNYDFEVKKLKNPKNIIPREGERFTSDGRSYDVISIHYNFDENKVVISCV